jgi:hypothetical protein
MLQEDLARSLRRVDAHAVCEECGAGRLGAKVLLCEWRTLSGWVQRRGGVGVGQRAGLAGSPFVMTADVSGVVLNSSAA